MKNINKIIIVVFIAVAFLSGCNEPSDPELQVMAVGEWYLSDLLVGDQEIYDYSTEFELTLNDDETCVFINHDGIGFAGTWSIDEQNTTLQLTPFNEEVAAVDFAILYLRPDKMSIQRTVTSGLVGTLTYTYILEK